MSVFPMGSETDPGVKSGSRPGGQTAAALWQRLRRWGKAPRLRQAGRLALSGIVAFCLSPAAMGTVPLPLLWGFLAALGADWTALMAGAAGCLGGALFWQSDVLMELLAGTVATLLATGLLSGCRFWNKLWFPPLICAGITGVLGLTFLLGLADFGKQELGELAVRMVAAAGSELIFFAAGNNRQPLAIHGAVALLLLGLCQIVVLRVVDIGVVLAALLVCGRSSFPLALMCGLGLDLAGITQIPMTVVLCLTCLMKKTVPRSHLGLLLPAGLSVAWSIPAGQLDMALSFSLLLGGIGSVFIPREKRERPAPSMEGRRMVQTAAIMEQLAKALDVPPEKIEVSGQLFDQAAAMACPGCARFHLCWQEESQRTYQLLAGALPGLLEGGSLPDQFIHHCRRPEAFYQGIRQGIDSLRLRRQYQQRLYESRKALARQYGQLARLLLDTAAPEQLSGQERYEAMVAVRSVGAFGARRSGDCTAQVCGTAGQRYVLLCDGMGTGVEAAEAGQAAVELLAGMLRVGLEPEAALTTLNDFYVLRETGGFSTADILELRLDTGRATLYKWGGAPSYLKRRNMVKRMGTAAPPPGVGIGETYRPEVLRLSLQRGQTVVLVSDGLSGEELQRRIAACADCDPRAMAAALTAGIGGLSEDDCTAVAVCLAPLSPGTL